MLSGFGADLLSADNMGDNLLHLATALPGITPIIKLACQHNCDSTTAGFCEEGRTDLVKWLLAKVS
jgi:hypothetical protein